MSESSQTNRPARRIVHLTGGQRAYDLGEANIRIGPDYMRHFLTFKTPAYDDLYAALSSLGLQPIGVDFITSQAHILDLLPPDFQTLTPGIGFAGLWAERAWSDVRNVPTQQTPEILDISARFKTYHRLMTLRIRELSEAYRRCLFALLHKIDGRFEQPKGRNLFANGFQTYVEAAIHAWLADAAGLRDLIAEAIWRLVLREPVGVTRLGRFLKKTRARTADHLLVAELHCAGAGGWLEVLTDLRNHVIHIAPLANMQELASCQARERPLKGGSIPTVHYPLTAADGTLRPRPSPIDFEDRATLDDRLRVYHEFVNSSGDALVYASQTTDKLISLCTRVREAAGLTHQIRAITDADIIGPIRWSS